MILQYNCMMNENCTIFRPLLLTLLFVVVSMAGRAQSHFQLGLGTTHILDTYLSQEKFHGVGLSLLTTHERRRDSLLWGPSWQHQLHLSTAKDRAGNSSLVEAMYKFYYGRYRRFTLSGPLELQVGAVATAGLGIIYDTRNGNNPVQARVGLHLMPSAKAVCRFRLFRHAARLRYQLDVPLCGVVFSPNYGQSYYELFTLGNYDHNIVPTTFVSAPTFRQQIALLYTVSPKFTFSIGYLGDYQQQRVNNLKQHVYDHAVMIGLAKNM